MLLKKNVYCNFWVSHLKTMHLTQHTFHHTVENATRLWGSAKMPGRSFQIWKRGWLTIDCQHNITLHCDFADDCCNVMVFPIITLHSKYWMSLASMSSSYCNILPSIRSYCIAILGEMWPCKIAKSNAKLGIALYVMSCKSFKRWHTSVKVKTCVFMHYNWTHRCCQ